MQHQLELGYLVLEVPDPDSLRNTFADVVGLVPGDATKRARPRGATMRAPVASSSRPDRPTMPSPSASRHATPVRSTAPWRACRRRDAT